MPQTQAADDKISPTTSGNDGPRKTTRRSLEEGKETERAAAARSVPSDFHPPCICWTMFQK
jgi:hypothetical protein